MAASLLGDVDWRGRLDADIAILELDEAHAVHFVNKVEPRFSLLLNVLRDQLDRFGEIDKTARLLEHIASKTTDTVVLNREDPRVARIAAALNTLDAVHHPPEIRYFGLDESLRSTFPPNDDEMRTTGIGPSPPSGTSVAAETGDDVELPAADVVLRRVAPRTLTLSSTTKPSPHP